MFFIKKENPLVLKNFFSKKIFFNKITGFNLINSKNNNFFFLKKNKFDVVFFDNKKNFLSFNFLNNSKDNFLNLKKNYSSFKSYNRNWLTIQQQPKTFYNYNYKIFLNLKNNISSIKNINETLSNTIFVKNRFISVDNLLYLPVRKNITIITNSFDVAHSWFVPGLGLKFDCIPGRSTHHSLFISKPGFYFGHCAEVCGRFHHHMPIKIIALNADHFIYFYYLQNTNFYKKNI